MDSIISNNHYTLSVYQNIHIGRLLIIYYFSFSDHLNEYSSVLVMTSHPIEGIMNYTQNLFDVLGNMLSSSSDKRERKCVEKSISMIFNCMIEQNRFVCLSH